MSAPTSAAASARVRHPLVSANWLVVLLLGSVTGCGGESDPTAIPSAPARPGGPRDDVDAGDSGAMHTDNDAGAAPTTFEGHCEKVAAAQLPLAEAQSSTPFQTSTETPGDFVVTRMEHAFDCARSFMTFTFGGGRCDKPELPELVMTLDVDAIKGGSLSRGQVVVTADAAVGRPKVSLRYRARGRSGAADDEWGTCGPATGTVDFRTTPSLEEGARFEGSFSTSLPPCDGTDAEPVITQGTFGLKLAAAWEAACAD